jgi:hypothetical protein
VAVRRSSTSGSAPGSASQAPGLLLCFVAAAVVAQRRKVLDDCRDCDDVLRLYSTTRIDFNSCIKKAFEIRSTVEAAADASALAAGL